MSPSTQLLLVYCIAWVPVAGLIWLARRRENDRTERLLRESTRHLQIVHVARGRGK